MRSGRRPPNILARFIALLILAAPAAYGLHYAGLEWWYAAPLGLALGYVLFLFLSWRFSGPDPMAPGPGLPGPRDDLPPDL